MSISTSNAARLLLDAYKARGSSGLDVTSRTLGSELKPDRVRGRDDEGVRAAVPPGGQTVSPGPAAASSSPMSRAAATVGRSPGMTSSVSTPSGAQSPGRDVQVGSKDRHRRSLARYSQPSSRRGHCDFRAFAQQGRAVHGIARRDRPRDIPGHVQRQRRTFRRPAGWGEAGFWLYRMT